MSKGTADRVGTLFKTDILFFFHSKWSFNKGTILQTWVEKHGRDIVAMKDDDPARTAKLSLLGQGYGAGGIFQASGKSNSEMICTLMFSNT